MQTVRRICCLTAARFGTAPRPRSRPGETAGTAWPDSPYRLLLRPGTPLDELPADEGAALAQLLADPPATDDAITALRRYSLISAPANGSVSVHRLVQAITVARLPASQAAAWKQATAALITAALPADPQLPAGWPVFAALRFREQRAPIAIITLGYHRMCDRAERWTDPPLAPIAPPEVDGRIHPV